MRNDPTMHYPRDLDDVVARVDLVRRVTARWWEPRWEASYSVEVSPGEGFGGTVRAMTRYGVLRAARRAVEEVLGW